MPRKYNPTVKTEYGRGMYDGDEYHDAVMEESEHGKWVKLETYNDETARLRAQIDRLNKHVHVLQDKLAAK